MKKIMFFLLFLLILGGAGFYFGWAQLKVPPGSYGVLRSKTHGIDPEVIREGKFRWIWYKLIPTNVETGIFSPRIVSHSIKSSGSLPSGKVYAALAGVETDFSWEITGDFSFSIKPDALPGLVLRENLKNQDDLTVLEENYARQIEALVLRRLAAYGEDESKAGDILLGASLDEVSREIAETFPELEKVSCRIQGIRYPDYRLYRSVRGLYDEYLARQQSVLAGEVRETADNRMGTRLRLDELEKYGEILTRYPILLQYLALEKEVPPPAPLP